ncbi:ribonuclease Z [Sulfoacidibacillus thermotolerans]|uniref:Ribonuclease Z n=1 Tax=Sulfoacidibacillus thermotolerans TaxID=1765684 RepID=A0A2U3D9G4_SULT2|nr:ribonuclease Z [Sulfoacidibacillus thermotolerans]PWI57911.1 ribonuclease Z [Sulfoacidibacillus thermotolerans]
MQLIFLGTGAGAPTTKRNVSSTALTFDQGSEVWLFDCGEGTQQQIARSKVSLAAITHIFITHLHGDHLLGLPGLLGSRSLQARALTPLTLIGPQGLKEFVQCVLNTTQTALGYSVVIKEVSESGSILETPLATVTVRELEHGVKSFGYEILERPKPGKFRKSFAQLAGIPEGPLYGQLKRGEDIHLPDGRIFLSRNFVDPPVRGRKIAILGDTIPCAGAFLLANEADVLVHEATFAQDQHDLARKSMHSTAAQAAQLAKEAHARTLILTHVSARYENGNQGEVHPLLEEARAIFSPTYLAEDFFVFTVPRA